MVGLNKTGLAGLGQIELDWEGKTNTQINILCKTSNFEPAVQRLHIFSGSMTVRIFSTVILPLWISCLQVQFGPGMAVAGELLEASLEDHKGMLFN